MLLNTESLPFYGFGGATGQLGHKLIRQIILQLRTKMDKEVKVHECKDVQRKSKSESKQNHGCACTPWKLADLFKFTASCSNNMLNFDEL